MDVETLLASLGVKRLSEVLSSFGIRLAEPMLIKKTAEARAAELRLLTDAISEADGKLPEGTRILHRRLAKAEECTDLCAVILYGTPFPVIA